VDISQASEVDIVRIYLDADGESHFDDVQVDLAASKRSRRKTALALWTQSQAAPLLRRTGLSNTIGLLPDRIANWIFAQSIMP
jgi:hypothetical protein